MNHSFQEIIKPLKSEYWEFSPHVPATFPEHWHTMAEFIYCKNSPCSYSVNREQYHLNPGDVLMIWPTELHEIQDSPQEAATILQFNDDLLSHCRDFDVYYHKLRNIHSLREYSAELNERIANYLSQIEAIHQDHSEQFCEPKILIMIYQMLIELCSNLNTSPSQPSSIVDSYNHNFYVIKKACSYINSNYDRSLSEHEVAEHCGFSTYYFSKIFHEYTQETFPEYLTKKRLAAATKLLCSETISVADVAYQSGFQSISNFNKVFKKIMGCSPLQYRKLYSEDV